MTVNYTITKQEDHDPGNLPSEKCLREVMAYWNKYGREVNGVWMSHGGYTFGLWPDEKKDDGELVLRVNVWYRPPPDANDRTCPRMVQHLEVEV